MFIHFHIAKQFNLISLFSLLLSLLFLPTLVSAKVYKWTDVNGKVHYSDKPIDEKSKTISIKRQPTTSEVRQARERASSLIQHQRKVQEIAHENENEKKRAEVKAELESKKLEKLCEDARREKTNLGRGYHSYTTDKEGKRHFLSDAEKTREIKILEESIKTHCNEKR